MKIQNIINIRNIVALGMVATLVGAYNNCSNTKFSPSDTFDKVVDVSNVPEIVANCKNLAAKGQLKTLNQSIKFEDTKVETGRAEVCQFDVNGNLGQVNDQLQARYEQYQKLNLPANAVICDVQMSAGVQTFKYDDVFYLTFNDRVIASNLKPSLSRLDTDATLKVGNANVNLFNFSWDRLKTAPFRSDVIDDYCLGRDEGLSVCEWPQTEHTGNISFDFDPEILVNLGVRANAAQQKFGFVITGDNDAPLDCYHSKLEFQMKVQYYIQ